MRMQQPTMQPSRDPRMDAMPAGTLSPRGAVTGGGRPGPVGMPPPAPPNLPRGPVPGRGIPVPIPGGMPPMDGGTGAPTRPFNPASMDPVRPAGSGAVTGGGMPPMAPPAGGMPPMQPNQPPAKPSFGRKMNKGGAVKAKGGSISKASSASSRADGCATKGKTKGRFV